MDHPGSSFATSPWAAVLGHHAMGAPTTEHHPGFPHTAHHGMPMDLHVPQGFSYYRYRDDAFGWSDRKPSLDDVNQASAVNSRILELRKEKSRDAARSRRGKENYEFYELAKMLPLPAAITSQLDKASIIRLTISFLKLRDFIGHGDPPWNRENSTASKILKSGTTRRSGGLALDLFEQHQGTHILQSLDGFALAVAADGRFLYISETVSIYLGLSQVEMTGSSIFDYVHQADHAEITEQLGLSLNNQTTGGISSPVGSEEGTSNGTTMNCDVSSHMSIANSEYKGYERAFCIRMKSTLTKRGCHFKSSGYRVVLLLCKLRTQYSFSHNRKSPPPLLGMVALAIALPPPSVHEIRLECDMFVTRINFDFRIAHCEPKVTELLDYTPEEITGESLYTLCHGEDVSKLRKSHMDLISKGQVLTHYYRMMNKNGGYTWLQTCATVICSAKNAEEQNIICVNYVISAKENANLILDSCQMEPVKKEDIDSATNENDLRSPGNDPSNDGSGNRPDGQILPKLELGDSKGRVQSHVNMKCADVSGNATDRPLVPPNCDDIQVTPIQAINKRGRKRKLKPDHDEILPANQQKLNVTQNIMNENSNISVNDSQHRLHLEERSESSVKDLENAMSKHLPAHMNNTDFSADSLLKQQQDKNSTIQWIGHNNHLQQQQSPSMPATALLRQLYANRESVIRATTRPTTSGFIYSDGNSLPTPPSDANYDNQFGNLVTNYGTSYSNMEYNNAMTPPSSVSPRDSSNKGNGNYEYTNLTTSDSRYSGNINLNDNVLPSLPLKPQPYSAAAIHHHSNPIDAYSLDQSQYFSHHNGFHLYHKGVAGWYTPP